MIGVIWLVGRGAPSALPAEKYGFPPLLEQASASVRSTYAQVVAYRDECDYTACYCGCFGTGQRLLRDCFILDAQADGSFKYSPHAATWQTCLGEALDASRQINDGKSLLEIRLDIDGRFGGAGPGTDAPLPAT